MIVSRLKPIEDFWIAKFYGIPIYYREEDNLVIGKSRVYDFLFGLAVKAHNFFASWTLTVCPWAELPGFPIKLIRKATAYELLEIEKWVSGKK